jgi:hypothetical protein
MRIDLGFSAIRSTTGMYRLPQGSDRGSLSKCFFGRAVGALLTSSKTALPACYFIGAG